MNEKRRSISVLDVVIVLLIIAAVVAFIFRGELQKWVSGEADAVVTYEFRVTDLDPLVASNLTVGTKLLASDGSSFGEVLAVVSTAAETPEELTDGTVVGVANGKLDLSGSVTATGYRSGDFACLENGTVLVPGTTLRVSTGKAVFVFTITSVQVK